MDDERNFFNDDDGIKAEVIQQPEKTSKEARSQERLERLLGNLEQGWKITIKREQPSWCRGHLETIEIYDPSEDGSQVDLEYLVRMWGGQKLHLKVMDEKARWLGGGSISLFSYPPKVRGKLLLEEESLGGGPNSPVTQIPFPPYPPPPQAQFDMNKILDLISKQKGADIPTLLKLLEISQARSTPQYNAMSQMTGMADQMLGMMTLFKEMKNVFGDVGGGGSSDSDSLSPVFAEVIKGLVQTKNNTLPSAGTLVAPKKIRPKALPNHAETSEKPAIQKPNTERDRVLSLAEQLSKLDPEDASGVVLLAMDRMPADKREQAMKSFFSDVNQDDLIENEDDFVDDDKDQSDNIGDGSE